jgi:hypothetical protein
LLLLLIVDRLLMLLEWAVVSRLLLLLTVYRLLYILVLHLLLWLMLVLGIGVLLV